MSRFGVTWWGKRWLRTLEQLGLTYPDSRMATGRTLASKDAVDLMNVETGELSAWVDVPRKSFGVVVSVEPFTEEQWRTFDAIVASRLGNLADLLDDRLPTGIDRQLEPHGLTLFPGDGEIDTSCPCRDKTKVCVHVIALQHAFAVNFDDDPYLLGVLRGRDRETMLTALRSAGPGHEDLPPVSVDGAVPIASLSVADFYTGRGSFDALLRP